MVTPLQRVGGETHSTAYLGPWKGASIFPGKFPNLQLLHFQLHFCKKSHVVVVQLLEAGEVYALHLRKLVCQSREVAVAVRCGNLQMKRVTTEHMRLCENL